MSNEILYRKKIPLILTAVVATIMFLDFYTGAPFAVDSAKTIVSWSTIIRLFGQVLGVVSLLILNIGFIERKTPKRWYFSVIMIGSFLLFVVVGLVFTSSSQLYKTMYDNVNVVLNSAMMGVLGFYFIIGAYRAFKLGSLESAAFMFSLIIILFMTAPIGTAIWPGFKDIGIWIQMVPNKAAIRGILIGVALGTIVLAFRTLLGRETGYLGD